MVLPWSPDLIGDVSAQVLASGPIIALMDVAASIAVQSAAPSCRMPRWTGGSTISTRPAPARPIAAARMNYLIVRS